MILMMSDDADDHNYVCMRTLALRRMPLMMSTVMVMEITIIMAMIIDVPLAVFVCSSI